MTVGTRHAAAKAIRVTKMTKIAATTALLAAVAALLPGCSSMPADSFIDKLDPDTATTVTVMAEPVELLMDLAVTAPNRSSFAYLAPFDTDTGGEHALYLWLAATQNAGAESDPKVLCDGQVLPVKALKTDLAQFKLSKPPYALPTAWSAQWYFELPRSSLDCLGSAQALEVDAQNEQGQTERFTATGKSLALLHAFAHR